MKKKMLALLICLGIILTNFVATYAGDETYPFDSFCAKAPVSSTLVISK